MGVLLRRLHAATRGVMLPAKKGRVLPVQAFEAPEQDQPASVVRVARSKATLQRSKSAAEHRAKFYLKGRDALRALCTLFVEIHVPVAIVAVWMCGYYALVCFLVVRRFCRDAVASTPVRRPVRQLRRQYLLPLVGWIPSSLMLLAGSSYREPTLQTHAASP